MHSETKRARLVLWVFIFFALTFGAGLYWNSQGENMGQAAETINASKETVMTNTLVGYWTLDGNDIVWGDANEIKDVNPGTKHDGNVAGSLAAGSAARGRVGQGLLFNGTTDSISLGNVYNGVKTIAFWVKPNTTTQSLIDLNATATVDINAGTVRGNNFATPTIYVDGAATSTFPDTGWHHVAVTTGTGINASAAYIGQIASSYFGGIIDDIRFYSDALSATQVADLYRASGAREIVSYGGDDMMTNGLVGYWTFDGDDTKWSDTSSEIKDVSGNNNHGNALGSLSTASAVRGKLGQGLSFNGTSDYVSMAYSDSLDIAGEESLTIAGWFKLDSMPGDQYSGTKYWVFARGEDGVSIDYSFIIASDVFQLYPATGAAFNLVPPVGSWFHLAVVSNDPSNTVTGYYNGSSLGTVGVSEGWNDSYSGLTYIGRRPPGITGEGGTYFDGRMDDVRIYERVLSSSEIANLYNMGK